MKIAFIIAGLDTGGAERVISNLANFMSNEHDVSILTFSNHESFYKLESGIKHIKLNLIKESTSKFDSLVNTFSRVRVLQKALKNVNADINISFMTHTNILSIIASKLNNQKIIVSEHTNYNFYNSNLLNLFRKVLYKKADTVTILTIADKKNYNFLKNVYVMRNPLVVEPYDREKEKIILGVGSLVKVKRFDSLIRAFSKVKSDEWKLYIAGEGKERKNLENLVKKLNLSNVNFLGRRKDIFEIYAKSSIFVLSSQAEGFPSVLLEAMGSGCASISFDCPNGPAEIIKNGVNGLLVENQNIHELTQAIQSVIDDKVLREKLSQEAIKVKEQYDIKIIVEQWEKLIRAVLNV